MNELREFLYSKISRLFAQYKTDGIHKVGLSRAIGADYRGELLQRADLLASIVGLEVLQNHILKEPRHDDLAAVVSLGGNAPPLRGKATRSAEAVCRCGDALLDGDPLPVTGTDGLGSG